MKHKALLWFLAWVILATTTGCSKEDTGNNAEAANANTAAASGQAQDAVASAADGGASDRGQEPIPLEPVTPQETDTRGGESADTAEPPAQPAPQKPSDPRPTAPFGEKAHLLALSPMDRRPPIDTELGPLADILSASGTDRDVLTTLRGFFRAVANDKEYERYLDPNRRDVLVRSLTQHRESGTVPNSVRYGEVVSVEPGETRVNVRCYGDPGEAEGEVIVRENAGAWYVSVLAVDLAMLDVPPEPPSEPFEPSMYRFDMWE